MLYHRMYIGAFVDVFNINKIHNIIKLGTKVWKFIRFTKSRLYNKELKRITAKAGCSAPEPGSLMSVV